jgi:1-acyl-sn-glycerol-3-phosphate acyltransferase
MQSSGNVLRSALFFLWLVVTVVPWASCVLIASIFLPGRIIYRMCATWLALSLWGAKVICGVRWRVTGMENLPTAAQATEAVVLACKHQSALETFALPMLMPHPVSYVFKRELLWVPFFGWCLARLDMIHIDRSRRTEAWHKVAAQSKAYMKKGNWVTMFPEGTRIPRGEKGVYKAGASRLAITTQVPIVPIAVTSARCWPPRSFLLRPGVVEFSIGKPISSEGRQPDELMREVEAWIEAEMHRLDPQAYAAPAASAT